MSYIVEKIFIPCRLHYKIVKDYEKYLSKDNPGEIYPEYPSLDIISKQHKERYNFEYDLHNYIFESKEDYCLFLLKWL